MPATDVATRVKPAMMNAKGRAIRYIPESEMEKEVLNAAQSAGVEEGEARMFAACSRNVYGLGCVYPEPTLTRLESLCMPAAKEGEPWALLMVQCLRGKLPRLRSEPTASARMAAAKRRSAATRRKAAGG
eukprot:CAMPEP_0183360724 /NCGR_PEP_ID=MMETSP0164_2-20130417/55980_1 /TAXON_ID=221442 /ORGANISM="Coccolithus pelagicus ssp braarudi, Strain PLY182g" /LENGTH=129 /DNA_ID=CAMNT_0025535147 /DNA_START=102 /DNA_END=492 /DNA_ORIENTATION=+